MQGTLVHMPGVEIGRECIYISRNEQLRQASRRSTASSCHGPCYTYQSWLAQRQERTEVSYWAKRFGTLSSGCLNLLLSRLLYAIYLVQQSTQLLLLLHAHAHTDTQNHGCRYCLGTQDHTKGYSCIHSTCHEAVASGRAVLGWLASLCRGRSARLPADTPGAHYHADPTRATADALKRDILANPWPLIL